MAAVAEQNKMTEEVLSIYTNLVGIRDKLKAMKEAPKQHSQEEVHHFQQMLDAIDSRRKDGIFAGSLKSGVPEGQALCLDVLDESYDLVSELMAAAPELSPEIRQTYTMLAGIKNKLIRLKASRSYALDDVHHYQLMVDAIDAGRKDGIFGGDVNHIPSGQAQCANILFQVYELLRQLLNSAPEMNPQMRGIYSHLVGIRRKLSDMRQHNVRHASEDLHVYQVQLDAIDKDREDGIFGGSLSTKVPAGQALCSTLLAQCYKLVEELQETATDA
ncbi:hypothetical protein CLOM_g982 [Closterium sp. NIES-68]|nr:hypothetical protein CLOM_g982 [Closterium sp. NIES-68]GJP64217.1 hypothetical protein CLOP_g21229 [Closterium sp. NIES-67]